MRKLLYALGFTALGIIQMNAQSTNGLPLPRQAVFIPSTNETIVGSAIATLETSDESVTIIADAFIATGDLLTSNETVIVKGTRGTVTQSPGGTVKITCTHSTNDCFKLGVALIVNTQY